MHRARSGHHPLPAARAQSVETARRVLADGGSVLLSGPIGIDAGAVGRAVLRAIEETAAVTVVVGNASLSAEPLAAVAIAGLLPGRPTTAETGAVVDLALSALEVRLGHRQTVVLVERPGLLDSWSAALLAEATRRGVLQLVIPSTVGLPMGALAWARERDLLTPIAIPPLSSAQLAELAPDDVTDHDIERAVVLAHGSARWFRSMMDARWFADGGQMPALVRDVLDSVLADLPSAVGDVLALVAAAGVLPISILVAAATPESVQVALDAGLLDRRDDTVALTHRLLRARVEERIVVQTRDLATRLHTAAADTGVGLLLPADDDRPDAEALSALVGVAPTEVAAYLDTRAEPLPASLRVIHARALLVDGRMAEATFLLEDVLEDLLAAVPEGPGMVSAAAEEDLAEAAMMLAYLQSHLHDDLTTATATIASALAAVQDPDVRIRLEARQVTVEAFGPLTGVEENLAAWESGPLTPRTELEVAKARSLLDAAHRTTSPARLDHRLTRLLDQTGASPGERWSGLAGAFWLRVFNTGLPDAWDMAEAEIGLARSRSDLVAIGSWYALQTGALAIAGYSEAAIEVGARAEAALHSRDGFAVVPITVAFTALSKARCGDLAGASTQLARATSAASIDSHLTNAIAAIAGAVLDTPWAVQPDAPQIAAVAETVSQVGVPTLVRSLWRGVQPPEMTPLALSSAGADGAAGLLDRLSLTVAEAPADEGMAAAESLIELGHLALVHAGLRRRQVLMPDETGPGVLRQQQLRWVVSQIVQPGAPEALDGPVSTRQLEVAVLAAEGLADRAIADRLSLSTRTVSNHLSRLYRATGLGGRQELEGVLPPVRPWMPRQA